MHPAILKLFDSFRPGPVQGPEHRLVADSITLAEHDPNVRRLAAQCTRAMLELCNKSAHYGFICAAVAQEGKGGSPVEQYLREQLVAIQSEIALVNRDVAVKDRQRRAKAAEVAPLQFAAGMFSARIHDERIVLQSRIAGAEKARQGNTVAGLQGGLTMDEMRLLGKLEPSDATVARWKARVVEIGEQLAKIAFFNADPFKSPAHLSGLPIAGVEQSQGVDHAT